MTDFRTGGNGTGRRPPGAHDGPARAMMREIIKPGGLSDPSLWGLVAGNLLSIVVALAQGWNLGEVLWIYWFQSALIGLINFWRILTLRAFSTDGLKMNGRPVDPTPAARRSVAFFFLIHYGFFHVIYAVFLCGLMSPDAFAAGALPSLLVCLAGFIGAHGFSFSYNLSRDFRDAKPNLGTVMFYPYLRIVPMHLTILFGMGIVSALNGESAVLMLFMILKSVSDVLMHRAEHALFRKSGKGGFH